ncbi:2479_t:CDS:2 [Rhizophagus irregularis]|nr:2479_t:CDS:2 [Rhizophagus irregularis]
MPQANLREQTRSSAVDSNSAAIGESDQQLGEAQGNSAVAGHSRSASGSRVEWDAIMEIEFCRAIMKNRPVGIHRHFRMVNIHRDFNANSPVKCSIPELWEQFSKYYNIEKLEELEREFDDEGDEDGPHAEFTLPMEEYYNLIAEHRKAGSSRGASPSPAPSKSQKGKREPSSTPSHTASIETSPEPEDTKKSRRTRNARKSDASETVRTPAPAKRGRARKTSDAIPTSTGPSKRGGRRKQNKKFMSNTNIVDSSIAAVISRLCTHPLDTIRVRLQANTTNTFSRSNGKLVNNLFIQLIRKTPIKSYYNGLAIAASLGIPALSSYLFVYDKTKYFLSNRLNIKDTSALNYMASAAIAEICSGVFWTPMEVLKSKLQTCGTSNEMNRINTLQMSKLILENEGIKGFFRGYLLSLVVFIPHTMIYFVLYEKFKIWTKSERKLTNNDYLINSAAACSIAGSISNVLDIIKTRWQVSFSKETPLKIMKNMYKNEGGLRAFTKGMGARVLWMVPSSSISMTIYEILKNKRKRISS